MNNNISHNITIEFNSTSYSGQDVQDVLPDFITEHPTLVGLTWVPSAFGPEAFFISITIGAAVGVAQGFLSELGSDLYRWAKEKLLVILKKKKSPYGQLKISWVDIRVSIDIENMDELLDIFSELNLLEERALKSLPDNEVDVIWSELKEMGKIKKDKL